ncbi:MAG: hypothetical protein JO097_00970 [Acidobacteriaceae bacterium]|nr:hypothetical protein [Acidobacteriaceae bacterium]MBV9764156.1 hypothetical protein [Acidobacteriaceae bacterium]
MKLADAKSKLATAVNRAEKAYQAEQAGKINDSFDWWKLLFGERFPNYYYRPVNSIAQTQLEPKQLDRLAAQRELYSKAKRVQTWQIVLSVPCVIAWSFAVIYTQS